MSVAADPKPFFIYGVNAVKEKLAAASGGVIEIFIAEGSTREALRSIGHEARRQGIAVRSVSGASLTSLAGTEKHQGVVARVYSFSYGSFERLIERLSSGTAADCLVAIDGLTDPRNLGAILRTAEAAGVQDVVLSKDRTAEVTAAAVKASAGAAFHVRVCRVVNLRRAFLELKEKGYWIIGLDAAAEGVIYKKAFPDKLVIVLGAEGTGLRPLIKATCDFLVSIPMCGRVSSLNVSVAAGVFLYELARRRGFLYSNPS